MLPHLDPHEHWRCYSNCVLMDVDTSLSPVLHKHRNKILYHTTVTVVGKNDFFF